MILNKDYFDELEIKDEDIIDDVEEPEHEELTLDDVRKLPKQYSHFIRIRIEKDFDTDATFIQTSLLPRITKRLDTIFESYGIEHSEYVLVSYCSMNQCDTIVKYGNYQLFCDKNHKDEYISDGYYFFYITIYINYSQFTYKRAFRFLYTLIPNLYRMDRLISFMGFYSLADDYTTLFYFWFNWKLHNKTKHIRFEYYNKKNDNKCELYLCDEEEPIYGFQKRDFYYAVFRHFFKKEIRVPYKLIDKDVPLELLRLR